MPIVVPSGAGAIRLSQSNILKVNNFFGKLRVSDRQPGYCRDHFWLRAKLSIRRLQNNRRVCQLPIRHDIMKLADEVGICSATQLGGGPLSAKQRARRPRGQTGRCGLHGRPRQLGVNLSSSVRGKCYGGEAFRHDGCCDSNRSCNRRWSFHSCQQFLSLNTLV